MWGPEAARGRVEATSFARRFGTNLGIHRVAAGISQEDLGYRSGIHRTAVGQLERGERTPRADTLLKLAHTLGVSTDALLEGIVWKGPQITRGSYGIEVDPPGGSAS